MTRPPILSFVAGAGDMIVDLDRLMEFGAFVEGTSRSGKTNLVRVFLEQTYGQIQHIVLDVEGEYATLRSAERPYLIVGNGRDVALPIEADAIKRFVLAIVEKGVSVIVDLSEHDTEEQHTIVAAVCDALVSLPENHPGGAAVVLEELQEFAPEGGGKGTALRSVRRLSKRGLKRGVFIIGASQRVSDVSKGIVTQLKTKMIGGTDLKDAPRALEELGLPSRDRAAVTDLPQGEFWVKGPAFARHATHVHVPRSITAPPKRKRGDPPTPAPEAPAEIAALAAALAASAAINTPEDAPVIERSQGSSTPAKTTQTPVESTMNVTALVRAAREEARFEEAQRQERYRNVVRAAAEHALAELRAAQRVIGDQLQEIESQFAGVVAGIDEQWMQPVPPDPATPARAERVWKAVEQASSQPALVVERAAKPRTAPKASPAGGRLQGAQQRILDAIAFFNALGVAQPTKGQVAAAAGLSEKISTWRIHMGALRKGYVRDVGSEQLELTDVGRQRANAAAAPQTLDGLHRQWRSRLESDAQRRMLDVLVDARAHGSGWLSRGELGRRAGVDHTLSTMRIHLGRLRKFNLVEDGEHDQLRASSLLFPEGMR